MPFVNETPLEEVIKYIQTATVGKGMEQGLPIYVDPAGLELAEKTMASPIRINLNEIMLKTGLRLMLKQLEMGYYVKHGLVIITALSDEDYKDATNPGWRERQSRELGVEMQRGGGGFIGGNGGGGMGGSMISRPPAVTPADPNATNKATPDKPKQ